MSESRGDSGSFLAPLPLCPSLLILSFAKFGLLWRFPQKALAALELIFLAVNFFIKKKHAFGRGHWEENIEFFKVTYRGIKEVRDTIHSKYLEGNFGYRVVFLSPTLLYFFFYQ